MFSDERNLALHLLDHSKHDLEYFGYECEYLEGAKQLPVPKKQSPQRQNASNLDMSHTSELGM